MAHPSRLHLPVTFAVALACTAAPAAAHVERPAYFPDPAPDTSVSPEAGGEVPKIRSLASSLHNKPPGVTRVVCQPNSMTLARQSIAKARRAGYLIRPTDRRRLSAKRAKRLLSINRSLRRRCRFREIQPAVTASRNHDRVVVMPGLYTEPTARAKPTNDKACESLRTRGDRPGENDALSYAYQVTCPNDQNLIAVTGREIGPDKDPIPPRENRHGIPNLGKCIRCNVQIEGSGVSADDVVIDAGDESKGNGGPNGVGAKKDVVVRADRADGFVLRNVTVRHAGEHGVYVLETDGYMLDRFKAFYNKLYGTLTFASDHGVHQNCDAAGHGDSGVYPGGAPETGMQRPLGTKARHNQEIRWCDLHHNLAGYSGTNGNAAHIRWNRLYDNSLGLTTDVVTGAGHPGYPGDFILFEENEVYSNNFNTYDPGSDVAPAFPFPVGTGLWIAGGNHHTIRDNWFYDNWRRGTMVFSVPDSLVCGPAAGGNEQAGCDSKAISTSHYNQHYDNHMGVTPAGKADRNGLDFWWDSFPNSRGNCWYRNRGPLPISTSPQGALSDCNDGRDPARSVGTGSPENEGELISCVAAFETRNFDQDGPCPWVRSPSDPDGGDGQGAFTSRFEPVSHKAGASRGPVADLDVIPLGQMTCTEWNSADAGARARLAERVRAFAGGVVNTGERDIGTGAVLSPEEADEMFNWWCGRAYAADFLLYKLYSHAAAFARRR